MSSGLSLSRKLAAEFFGTFVFVLVGAGSALGTFALASPNSGSALLIGALANGLGLGLAVTATMGTSGGVLNPAVALALFISRKLPGRDLVPYMIAEVLGATAAGAALVFSFPSVIGKSVNWGAPTLGAITTLQGIAIEALLTFVLVFAVFLTAVDSKAPKVAGFGIAAAVLVDVLVGGALTGAAMNPARAYGPMLAGGFFPSYWYVYVVGPAIGAVACALVFRFLLESRA